MSDVMSSPVITKPEDKELLAKLERKLIEYEKRVAQTQGTMHPELAYKTSHHYRDSLYKSSVLRELLTKGKVKTHDFSLELAKRFCESFDVDGFNNACAVVEAYCKQQSNILHGGTGLN